MSVVETRPESTRESKETRAPEYSRAAIHGTAWRYGTFFTGKMMVFVSTVVLARLLSKDDFGVVAYAVTTINFMDVASDLGVGPALIYHRENPRTRSTAFWLGLINGCLLYTLAFLVAPLVGLYLRDPRATEVTRVLALTFPLSAIGDTHNAVLRKTLAFGRIFVPDILSALTKGLASIVFAFLGFGVWSLILGQLSGVLANVIALWIVTPWHPSFTFDKSLARSLTGYGVNIVGVDTLALLLQNLDYLLVGRYLGAEMLGIYTLAFRLPDLLILQFARILSTVLFPIYTRMREKTGSLARGFYATTRYVSLFTMPLGVGMALVARPFTLAIFTEKWAEAIPVIQGISIYAMLLSLAYNAGSAYKAEGRPQVLTWLGLVRLAMLFPALFWAVTVTQSIVMVGWMQALIALIGGALNLIVAARLLGLPMRELVAALRPGALASTAMAVVVIAALIVTQESAPILQLIFSVGMGGLAYMAALWFLQRDVIMEVQRKLRLAVNRSK
jgi:O-antigen/teichoic acid export membrane protein